MKPKTTYYITGWDADRTEKIKQRLIDLGVDKNYIVRINDRHSRAPTLNKYLNECRTKYAGLIDDDCVFSDNCPSVLEELLDNNQDIGIAVAPVTQITNKTLPEAKWFTGTYNRREDVSSHMATFNFTLFRVKDDILMDNDLFGNQNLDIDIGLEYLYKGYKSVADHQCGVAHLQTDYVPKNLFYHAAVARNRHLFMLKWSNRKAWSGVESHNRMHNNEVPTIEELSHSSEQSLLNYIARFDKFGLWKCYFEPRVGDRDSFLAWQKQFHEALQNNKQEFGYVIENGFPKFFTEK